MERTVKVTITRVRRCRMQVPLMRERCAICQRRVEIISKTLAAELLAGSALTLDELLAEDERSSFRVKARTTHAIPLRAH